jgi:geranylgeranyl diphosphate synthase type I
MSETHSEAVLPMRAKSDFLDQVRASVDARLTKFFRDRRTEISTSAPEAMLLLDGLDELTMRGGKRLRPAVLVAAQRAIRPFGALDDVLSACAGLEILQSYLLIHDDWMDGDEERRGGPSVHVLLGKRVGQRHLGDALAILSGDLGSAYAWDLVMESAALAPSPAVALAVFSRMQRDVVLGQALDLTGSLDVTRMQQLKTGSYTVDGPLALGATLAGASREQLAALARFGAPVGEAFQMRDDLLGTFGDPAVTGKPVGNDLRVGKRTALVREAETSVAEAARAPLTRVLGRAEATDVEIREAMAFLESSGARERVEARLDALMHDADAALEAAPISDEGKTLLRAIALKIAQRAN